METVFKILILCILITLNPLNSWGQCGDCEISTDQLIENWNFSEGDVGFYSDYDGDPNPGGGLPPLWNPGTYQVGNDAGDFHWDFEGWALSPFPFFGNFMVVNGSSVEGQNIWCQDIPVVPGGLYDFSMWVQSVVTQNPASLQVQINGMDVGGVFNAPANLNNWQEHTFSWEAPDGTLVATICITNVNTIVGGNDFGLDAISFTGCEPIQIQNQANAGADATICSGETFELGEAASPGISYQWEANDYFDDLNNPNPSVSINNPGADPMTVSFILQSDTGNIGCISIDTVVVTVEPLVDIDLEDQLAVCNFPVTLDAGNTGDSYLWNTGADTQQIEADEPGTYTVEVTTNGCVNTAETEVNIVDFESVDLGADQVVCTLPITLDAGIADAEYLWSNGEDTPTISAQTPGVYSVTVVHNGCESYDEVEVIVDNYLTFSLGDDLEVCTFPVSLDAPISDANYSWSNGDNQESTLIDEPGWVFLEIELDGCSGMDSLLVEQVEYENVDLGPDQTVCSLPITISSDITGESYEWSSGENTPSIEVNTPGDYTITVTQNGCESSDEITVVVDSEIPLDLGPDFSVCAFPVQIESPVGDEFNLEWSDGTTEQTITVNEEGIVELIIEQDGCIGNDQIEVSLIDTDDPNIPDSLESCVSPVEISTDLQNATWTWSTGDQAAETMVNSTGWIYLDYEQYGCSKLDSTYILIDNTLELNMPAQVDVCDFPYLFESGINAESFDWSNGGNAAAVEIDEPGSYALTASLDGCEGSQEVLFHQIQFQSVDLYDSTVVCEWPANISTGVTGADYAVWSNGQETDEISISEPGIYSVQVSHNGCASSDETEVFLQSEPYLAFPSEPYSFCSDDQLNIYLDAANYTDLYWSHGPTSPQIVISTGGFYSVTAENECGAVTETIDVIEEDCTPYLFIPNAFTPNEDGINDLFEIHATNFVETSFSMYSRNGELIFHTDDVTTEKWNGNVNSSEYYSSPTVFVYRFRGKTIRGKIIERNGFITLVR